MRRYAIGAGVVLLFVVGLVALLTAPVNTRRALVLSVPPDAVLPHLTDPPLLLAWMPRALGAETDGFEPRDEADGVLITWHGPAGEGAVLQESARVAHAARLQIRQPNGAVRLWRLRLRDAGHYGLELTLHEAYRPAGLFQGLARRFGGSRHGRALERGLSALRGDVLSRFGAAGGSYRPPDIESGL